MLPVVQDGLASSTYVGRTNLIDGVKFRPSKSGDIIALYGIGFGPVSPDNPAGVVTTESNSRCSVRA